MNAVVPYNFASHRSIVVAPRNVLCYDYHKHECRSSIVFCIPKVAPRNVNDVSCAATIKHECRSAIAFCIALVVILCSLE